MAANDPYYLAWKNQGIDAAAKLAIANGENLYYGGVNYNPKESRASVLQRVNTGNQGSSEINSTSQIPWTLIALGVGALFLLRKKL